MVKKNDLHTGSLQKATFFVQIQSSPAAGSPFDLALILIRVALKITLLALETSEIKRVLGKCWAEDYVQDLSFLPPETVLLERRVGRCTGVNFILKGSPRQLSGEIYFSRHKSGEKQRNSTRMAHGVVVSSRVWCSEDPTFALPEATELD